MIIYCCELEVSIFTMQQQEKYKRKYQFQEVVLLVLLLTTDNPKHLKVGGAWYVEIRRNSSQLNTTVQTRTVVPVSQEVSAPKVDI